MSRKIGVNRNCVNSVSCVNRCLVNTFAWMCPVPHHCSLSCVVIELHSISIFLGEGLSILLICVSVWGVKASNWRHGS